MDAGVSMSMNTLSRREEETLVKTAKAKAMRECDPIVKRVFLFSCVSMACGTECSLVSPHVAEIFCFSSKSRNTETHIDATRSLEFADCAHGRTLSVAWACRDKYKAVQDCMLSL